MAELAQSAGIPADAGLIDRVAQATAFETMKANAGNYVPVAGTGFWKSDAEFFHSASSRKWEGEVAPEDLAHYRRKLEQCIPDTSARSWLEHGAPVRSAW